MTTKAPCQSSLPSPLRHGMQNLLLVIIATVFYLTLSLHWIDENGNGAIPCSSSSPCQLPTIEQPEMCDYSRGRWVPDESRPLYIGSSCKLWLAPQWDCRLSGRLDFQFEKYRWKPDECDMPAFNGSAFLSMMQNKVLAFVGDSIGRQQYQSMMCLITGGKEKFEVEDVSLKYGFSLPKGGSRTDGTAQRFVATNTTIIYHWSASLCLLEPLNKKSYNTDYAMHLDRPAFFLQKYISLINVLVLNTGHHWNRGKFNKNRWIMYINGSPNTNRKLRTMGGAYNFTVHSVMSWVNREKGAEAKVFLRSISPRHFFHGEWDSGGRCDDNTVPLLEKNVSGFQNIDPIAESAVAGTHVKLLNVTYLSQFRDEAHISKYRLRGAGQDCLHWCLPGVPDVWNEILSATLMHHHLHANVVLPQPTFHHPTNASSSFIHLWNN